MKDLDDPTAEDVEIFQNSINDFVIVTRDNSHVVNCGKTTCTILIFLNIPTYQNTEQSPYHENFLNSRLFGSQMITNSFTF